ncbi:MAG: dihydropteroate synthase [Pseudomonadales bacterium]|nr:dihydropteroate synthase [Pseudomonadales bacterium]
MGILNVTPDSFSDGGRFETLDAAVARARQMIDEGADIIDIGGESTRPGADPVPADVERERVIPVLKAIRAFSDIPVSVDTSSPEVIEAAAQAGASMINDVRALRRDGALAAAAATGLPICLMHMKGDPKTMQADPHYDDVVSEVIDFFMSRIGACESAGIDRDRLVLDPGFGFGKTPAHNLTLVNRLGMLKDLGRPLLVGLSRKSTIAKILAGGSADLVLGSVAGAVVAVLRGADIVRVHDVGPTVQALRVTTAIQRENISGN